MPRWVTVRKPFNYHWPDRSAVTSFKEPGDQFVKDEVADFAVKGGYATEGKVDETSRSHKGKRRASRRKKEAPAAKAADTGSAARVDHPDAAGDDSAAGGPAVDHDAG